MWLFHCFNFGRNCDVLKSESPSILLNKNINFSKKETELKMENPTYNFTETNFVLQLIQESQIKIKTLMSWRSQKKRIFFVPFLYSKCETFLANVFFLMYSVLNAFSEYRYFYISKHITSQFFYCFFFKFAESIQLIFN